MPINAAWHGKHPMPQRPTPEQRMRWHVEHAQACSCGPIPPTLQAAILELQAGRRSARPRVTPAPRSKSPRPAGKARRRKQG